jgi:hypothetical protein
MRGWIAGSLHGAARRTGALKRRATSPGCSRFVVLAGLLGRWYPDAQVGDISLPRCRPGAMLGRC